MHYHLARESQQLGQFSEEEVRAGLFEGRYLPTDLAWREGQADWQALSDLFPQAGAGGSRLSPGPPRAPFPLSPQVASQTNGLAVASLVMGIVSMVTCGILGVGSIVTIILGHLGLSKARQYQGQMGGKGMAIAGLIMGYISLVIAAVYFVAVFASLSIPTFNKIQERGLATKSISNAKQLLISCRLYASDHQGRYPQTLHQLVQTGIIDQDTFDKISRCPLLKDDSQVGYEYYGAGLEEFGAGDTVILMSKAETGSKRVIGRNDGSVSLAVPPLE